MAVIGVLCLVGVCKAVESPEYTVAHSESEFEIRLYTQSTWMSASVPFIISFEKATRIGYHRFYFFTFFLVQLTFLIGSYIDI